jgi:hypothetical protein
MRQPFENYRRFFVRYLAGELRASRREVFKASRGPRQPIHLCLDKGYDYRDSEAAVRARWA